MNLPLPAIARTSRTLPRFRTLRLFGTAFVVLLLFTSATLAAWKARRATDAPPSIDVISPTDTVILPNGAPVSIKGVGGHFDDERRNAVWEADGSALVTDKLIVAAATCGYSLSSGKEPQTRYKDRAIAIETRYVDLDQPVFVWAGEGTPDNAHLLPSQSEDGKHYFFEPKTNMRSEILGGFDAKVVPGSRSAKTGSVQLRYFWSAEDSYLKDASDATVQIAVAAGNWPGVFRCPAKPGDTDVTTSFGRVRFSAHLQPRLLCIVMDDYLPGDYTDFERQLVAVDKAGRVVAFPEFSTDRPMTLNSKVDGERIGHREVTYFPRTDLSEIAEFRLLARPFYHVTFHHVALEPKASVKREAPMRPKRADWLSAVR